MIRGLHRKAYVLEFGLSLLLAMAMVGCGGGGGGITPTPQNDNPVPAISTISPASATAGAAKQTLTINGTSFLDSSTVTYNAVAHAATFVNSTQLTISLSASDQTSAGSYPVVVTNPTPGGGASNSTNFMVNNPAPVISSLSPTSATAGAAAQTVTINGTNFLSNSAVTYNAVVHAATFVSSTQLTISLSASDQATTGSYPVVVTNPTPGGGSSAAADFTVNNIAPGISSLSPASATAGAGAQTLTINGTNFLTSSTVTFNAAAHAATLVSATKLTILLSANDQAKAGSYPVVVTNPAPGGASNTVNFVVNTGSSVEVTLNGSSSGTANETVGGTLPISALVTGATADLTFTVNGINNGNATFGTISGIYPNYNFLAPASIPADNNPVTIEATQGDTGETASLAVTINPSTSTPTAITITGGNATGIDFNLTPNPSLTLGLADVGTCSGGSCSASVTGIEVSLSGQASASCPATCTLWVLGQGLTNASGTAVASGLKISVSGGSSPDVTVTSGSVTPMAPCSPSNPNCTSSVTLEDLTFQVVASASATPGVRNIVVTLGDGETQVYVGAIQIVP